MSHVNELFYNNRTINKNMLLFFFIIFELFYIVTCFISCYHCPMQFNTFDSIITIDTISDNLQNCSITNDQVQCSIQVIWVSNPNQTQIALLGGGGEERDISDEHNLKNDIILMNDGTKIRWTNRLYYLCSTDKCNSPSTFKRLLRSLRSEDQFNELSDFLVTNEHFNGTSCFFFENSSRSCDSEIDHNTCKQCIMEVSIQSSPLEICANCILNDFIQNFITYEVKFFMNDRTRDDFWMIKCQLSNCNAIQIGSLIRQKSSVQFNFDLFLNNSAKQSYNSLTIVMILILIVLFIKGK